METESDTPDGLKTSPEFYNRLNFFAGGVINLYQLWFQGKMEQSLEDISHEISKLITVNNHLFHNVNEE
jgi:hypothetical protein